MPTAASRSRPKTTSIRAWAVQLEQLAQTRAVRRHRRHMVATAVARGRQPARGPGRRSPGATPTARRRPCPSSSAPMRRGACSAGATDRSTCIITALARCLSSWTASPTILIDLLSHGRDAVRERVNLSRTVGFTLSYNPLVLRHPTWQATRETLDAVTAQIERSPEGFSFELLRFLAPDIGALRDRLTAPPRADVLFNFAGAPAGEREDARWTETTDATGPDASPRGLRQYPTGRASDPDPEPPSHVRPQPERPSEDDHQRPGSRRWQPRSAPCRRSRCSPAWETVRSFEGSPTKDEVARRRLGRSERDSPTTSDPLVTMRLAEPPEPCEGLRSG